MNQVLLGLLAETFIHPGSGQHDGVVDLPVAREAATDYPFIAGSSFKGALLDMSRQIMGPDAQADRDLMFGKQSGAGQLLVGDARLLLLPVRSLTGAYRWVTCPHILERFHRDCLRSRLIEDLPISEVVVSKNAFLGEADAGAELYLEERQFHNEGRIPEDWLRLISRVIPHAGTAKRLPSQLVVLEDDDMNWFARRGLAVHARNVLDPNTKVSTNLWYEESLPADTVMYSLVAERDASMAAVEKLVSMFKARPYIQTGGNETVGQGWFKVTSITAELEDQGNG